MVNYWYNKSIFSNTKFHEKSTNYKVILKIPQSNKREIVNFDDIFVSSIKY